MFVSHSTIAVFFPDEHHEKYETLPGKLCLSYKHIENELQQDGTVENCIQKGRKLYIKEDSIEVSIVGGGKKFTKIRIDINS